MSSLRAGRRGIGTAMAVTVAAAVIGAVPVAWAAQLLTTASLIPSTSVTVSRADGHAVKGTITACTPELLTVLPDPKPVPKPRPGVTPVEVPKPDPVAMPWKDVRRVSSGLTPLIALQMWRAENAAKLCPTCRGERTVWCPVCKGTRHDPAAAADCKTCRGELLVDCKTKGEADGTIPCPNGCLRLGVGNWSTDAKGEMWCKFPLGNGASNSWSNGHVGQVILVDHKNHTAVNAGVCPICGGTIKIDDPVCYGSGKVPCPECLARRSAGPCPNHCDAGRVVCPTCGGSGLAKG